MSRDHLRNSLPLVFSFVILRFGRKPTFCMTSFGFSCGFSRIPFLFGDFIPWCTDVEIVRREECHTRSLHASSSGVHAYSVIDIVWCVFSHSVECVPPGAPPFLRFVSFFFSIFGDGAYLARFFSEWRSSCEVFFRDFSAFFGWIVLLVGLCQQAECPRRCAAEALWGGLCTVVSPTHY